MDQISEYELTKPQFIVKYILNYLRNLTHIGVIFLEVNEYDAHCLVFPWLKIEQR